MININDLFSRRRGIIPKTKIELESMNSFLQNGLWSNVVTFVLNKIPTNFHSFQSPFYQFSAIFWTEFYKRTIDTVPNAYDMQRFLRDNFFQLQWNTTFDFLEFITYLDSRIHGFDSSLFKNSCNNTFELENSPYRFVGHKIVEITNKVELAEIDIALDNTKNFTAIRGANIHLTAALDKLADRNNPDYRNSIKESISAVENISKKIAQSDNATLGTALDILKNSLKINGALIVGFKNIYGYTSDADGIRHALKDDDNCNSEDARFMLVSCSAFINYLIGKAIKAGINLK